MLEVLDFSSYSDCFEYKPSSEEFSVINVNNGEMSTDDVALDSDNNLIWVKDKVNTFKFIDNSLVKIATFDHNEWVVLSLSESAVKDFIMRRLGYPVVRLELTLRQIKDSIDEAIEEMAPWVVQPTYLTVDFSSTIDLSEYNVSYIINVIPADRDTSYGVNNGVVTDIFSTAYYGTSGYREQFYRNIELGLLNRIQSTSLGGISWNWISSTEEMLLDVGSTGANRVTIEYSPKIRSIDDLKDDIYITFAKKFALAFTRELLSDIRGKFKVDGSPVELDASEQHDKSSSELERLRTELKETVSTHFMID